MHECYPIMNRIFNTNFNHRGLDIALLILRFGIAALMLTHGLPKLNTLLEGGDIQFADPIGIGAKASLALAVFAEVCCSFLLILGLATRLAVLPLMVTMLVALLAVHADDPIGKQEPALHYLLVYLVLLITGAGAISLDKIISRKGTRSRRGY
ncbi:putative oxidoreductase [Pedobacter hartonius]|uniref:Putative oxidoreductase n=2 Tax=Pedobacter hartonius TaxID=425514 RepID=A0A1H3X824_9SPHI|nr:putative oxidoreductase [Pedobacter hartonius]